jgi:translation initiation factor IF-1
MDDKKYEVDATVLEVLPNSSFKLKIEGTEHTVIGYISGKMRMNYIKITVGDRVKVEMTQYDLNRGRITYRYNK